MVKPAYLAFGGLIAAGAAWWYLRGKSKPTDNAGQKPLAIDITVPSQPSGGSSDFLTELLNTANLLPVSAVLPNSTGPTTAVAPAVVAPAVVAPVAAPVVSAPSPVVPSGDKNPYAGNPMFDPVVQAYSSDFAAHNANGGGFSFVTAVGGLEGYRAGNRA